MLNRKVLFSGVSFILMNMFFVTPSLGSHKAPPQMQGAVGQVKNIKLFTEIKIFNKKLPEHKRINENDGNVRSAFKILQHKKIGIPLNTENILSLADAFKQGALEARSSNEEARAALALAQAKIGFGDLGSFIVPTVDLIKAGLNPDKLQLSLIQALQSVEDADIYKALTSFIVQKGGLLPGGIVVIDEIKPKTFKQYAHAVAQLKYFSDLEVSKTAVESAGKKLFYIAQEDFGHADYYRVGTIVGFDSVNTVGKVFNFHKLQGTMFVPQAAIEEKA